MTMTPFSVSSCISVRTWLVLAAQYESIAQAFVYLGIKSHFAEMTLEEGCALFYCYSVLTEGIFNFSVTQEAVTFSVSGDSTNIIFISEDPSG